MSFSPRRIVHDRHAWVEVGVGVVGAALTLVDPLRLSPGRRLAYRSAVAALAGVSTLNGMRSGLPVVSPQTRTAVAIAAAGVVFGAGDAGDALDARMVRAVGRTGVPQPRRVAALLGLAMVVAGAAVEVEPLTGEEQDHEPVTGPVPDEARALLELLLSRGEEFGAAALRDQLVTAAAVEPPAVGEPFEPFVHLVTDDAAPRSVPGEAVFPVVGRFTALDDRSFDVVLTVCRGGLSELLLVEGGDWSADRWREWSEGARSPGELGGWPDPAQVQLLVETPEGLVPVSAG